MGVCVRVCNFMINDNRYIECTNSLKFLRKIRFVGSEKIFVNLFVSPQALPQLISFDRLPLTMSKMSFSTLAYCKMVAHAAKYPHCEVNGLLIAETPNKGDKLTIVDTVPLFHQCLHVSPMSEIALMQVDQSASTCNMYIAGYYLANETLDDLR